MEIKMSNSLSQAISLLKEGNYTCVLCKNGIIYTSKLHGVLPLMNWLSEKADMDKAAAADKIVGKAAALLYVKLGVKEVYADTISVDAINIFNMYGISFIYSHQVKNILNKAKTGICPMENLVRNIESSEQAFYAIKQMLEATL